MGEIRFVGTGETRGYPYLGPVSRTYEGVSKSFEPQAFSPFR